MNRSNWNITPNEQSRESIRKLTKMKHVFILLLIKPYNRISEI